MVIKDKKNFVSIVARLLKGIGYTDVKENTGEAIIDITASNNGEKYCFKCQYDIDAIGEKKIDALIDEYKKGQYDKAVFVTNSSFLSSAKKKGEGEGIELWDRNTIDRLSIGVSERLEDTVIEKKGGKGYIAFIVAAVIVLLVGAAAVYYFYFK